MKAREIMTANVISVTPDAPIQAIAKLLLDKGISAVPVVGEDGAPLGVVSEGDLVGRDETAREARRDWWLELLAEGEALHPDFLASLRAPAKRARDVMSSPVVTIGEETDTIEIARLLTTHHVKRLPVMRDGRIVGIVSRADLLHTLLNPEAPVVRHAHGLLSGVFASLDDRFLHRQDADETAAPAHPEPRPEVAAPLVTEFQDLVSAAKRHDRDERDALRQAATERRQKLVTELVDEHISDDRWQGLLDEARKTAEHGGKQMLLLRFPCDLCTDGGRTINAAEPGWPSTLRGEAAEIYLRWERELKPHGFRLSAAVMDFPDGKPGDIGLFLVWAA